MAPACERSRTPHRCESSGTPRGSQAALSPARACPNVRLNAAVWEVQFGVSRAKGCAARGYGPVSEGRISFGQLLRTTLSDCAANHGPDDSPPVGAMAAPVQLAASTEPSVRRARRRWAERIVAVSVWMYLVVLLGSWLLIRFAGDRWWFATLMLFGPRWLAVTPILVLAPAAALTRRRPSLGAGVGLSGRGGPDHGTVSALGQACCVWRCLDPRSNVQCEGALPGQPRVEYALARGESGRGRAGGLLAQSPRRVASGLAGLSGRRNRDRLSIPPARSTVGSGRSSCCRLAAAALAALRRGIALRRVLSRRRSLAQPSSGDLRCLRPVYDDPAFPARDGAARDRDQAAGVAERLPRGWRPVRTSGSRWGLQHADRERDLPAVLVGVLQCVHALWIRLWLHRVAHSTLAIRHSH